MTSSIDQAAPASPQPVEKANPFQRMIGVLVSPSETFASIARKPDWVVPLLVLCIVSMVCAWMIASRIDFHDLARQTMEMNPRVSEMPAEQQNRMIGFTSTMMKVTTYVSPVLSIIGLLIIAGVLLLGVRMMGGVGNFGQAFSVSIYGWIPRLIKGVISVIVLMNRKSISIYDLQNPVRSNLGFLFDPKTHPVAFALWSSFDVFAIWSLVLYIIGFAALSRLTRGRTAAIVITIWLVVVLLSLIGPAMQGMKMK
jgi:hypothetical protein